MSMYITLASKNAQVGSKADFLKVLLSLCLVSRHFQNLILSTLFETIPRNNDVSDIWERSWVIFQVWGRYQIYIKDPVVLSRIYIKKEQLCSISWGVFHNVYDVKWSEPIVFFSSAFPKSVCIHSLQNTYQNSRQKELLPENREELIRKSAGLILISYQSRLRVWWIHDSI